MPAKARQAASAPRPGGDAAHASEADATGCAPRRWRVAAVAILLVLAASATFTRVWNFDVFWHLAAGEWMLRHKAVLRHDPFSSETRASSSEPREWVNVHWLFEIVVAGLHAAGGFALLSVLKCALAVATMFALAWALRRRVPPGWLIFSGAAMLAVMAERVRVRPELFTCALLMVTVVLLESVRLGAARGRLWWLVPIMLVWVNMHGLYFLGLGVIWSSVLGAWLDRKVGRTTGLEAAGGEQLLNQRALGPILAATVACLVSPWPIRAAAHPLLLWTRVSGQAIAYTYGVSELQPTWEALGKHWPAVTAVALIVLVMLANRRRVPLAHAIWLAAFAFIGLLARRNVGLIAPVCGYLLAWHGAAVVRGLAGRGARWRRLGAPFTWLAAAAGVLLAAAYATELVHRLGSSTERFGAGLLEQNYPIRMAEFLRDLDAEGEVLCENFGNAAVFMYHTTPRRKVWMDGRLEVHSVERFAEQTRIANELRTEPSATWADLPDEARFLVVQHQHSEPLSAMMESRRFRLIRVDPPCVCFVRTDYRPRAARPEDVNVLELVPNLADHDRLLTPEHLVEGFGTERRRWYRQNPAPRTYWMGAMLHWLGRLDSAEAGSKDPIQHLCTLLAIRYLTAACTEDLVPPDIATGMLAWAHHQQSLHLPVSPGDEMPVDIHLARALYLYQRLDLENLRTQTMRAFADRHVHALVYGRQFDAADRAIRDLLRHLPPAQRVNPPRDYLKIRGTIAEKLAVARVELALPGFRRLRLLERARAMVHQRIGMIDRAIEELESLGTSRPAEASILLGDLHLRRGRPRKARGAYRDSVGGRSSPRDPCPIRMRFALCDWVEGGLFEAERALSRLAHADRPAVRYYHAVLLEQLGRYDAARRAASPAVAKDPRVQRLLERIRNRLETR